MNAIETKPLLRPGQVSKALAVSDDTLRRLTAEGTLPAVRLGKRCVRYKSADVERLLNGDQAAGGVR